MLLTLAYCVIVGTAVIVPLTSRVALTGVTSVYSKPTSALTWVWNHTRSFYITKCKISLTCYLLIVKWCCDDWKKKRVLLLCPWWNRVMQRRRIAATFILDRQPPKTRWPSCYHIHLFIAVLSQPIQREPHESNPITIMSIYIWLYENFFWWVMDAIYIM